MDYIRLKHSFPMILSKDSKLLVLGSFPSVKSRELDFYYMNPNNRFWRMLSVVLCCDFCQMSNEEKRATLIEKGVALYDIVTECDITGSLDSSIRNVSVADVDGMIEKSQIEKILCNGLTCYKYLMRYFPHLSKISVALPSTSPTNAATSFERLLIRWEPEFKGIIT